MANLRFATGNALKGAGDTVGQLIQDMMLRGRQREQEAEITKRELLMQEGSQKGALALKQAPSYAEVQADEPGAKLGRAAKPIQAAKTLLDVPTDADIPQLAGNEGLDRFSYGSMDPGQGVGPTRSDSPDIQTLLAQAASKRSSLAPFEPTTNVSSIDPDSGLKYDQHVPNSQLASLGGLLQTVPPAVEATNKNTETELTSGPEASAAGAKARAVAAAQAPYEKDLIRTRAKADSDNAYNDALARAKAQGDVKKIAALDEARKNAAVVAGTATKLQQLWDRAVATKAPSDIQAYAGAAQNLRPMVARATGYTGRISNVELGIAGGLIPSFSSYLTGSAEKQFQLLENIGTLAPQLLEQLPPDPTTPLSAYMEIADQIGKDQGRAVNGLPQVGGIFQGGKVISVTPKVGP